MIEEALLRMYSNHKIKEYICLPKLLLTVVFLYTFLSLSFFAFKSNIHAQIPSLAEKVFDKYQTLLQREDIKKLLPLILVEIKKPETQSLLTPDTINLIVDSPGTLKQFVPDIDDEFITLLEEDQEIQTFLRDPDVQTLLKDLNAIDELTELLRLAELSLAEQVVEKHASLFEREDIMEFLPIILVTLRKPDIQALITPEIIKQVVANPDILKTVLPDIDERFITFLKDDADVMTFISDPDVQLLLQDPEAIDEVATILNLRIGPPAEPWDVNKDGMVNILDLTFVASHFGSNNPPPEADVNRDGRVNILDLTLVASHFGEQTMYEE